MERDNYVSTFFQNVKTENEKVVASLDRLYGSYLPLQKDALIVDIGFGLGFFLKFLKSKGYNNLQGVEIGREQFEYVKTHICKNVTLTNDTYKWLKQQDLSFDLIVLLDVIEHFKKEEIVPFLSLAYSKLSSGGRLLLRTINSVGISAAFTRYMDFTQDIAFNEISIMQILKIAGFKQIKILDDTNYHNNKIKSKIFLWIRRLYFSWLRSCYYLERPGVIRPKHFSYKLHIVGEKSEIIHPCQ
ncbi:MAG: class I SAM-dependent methyltransferase [bacterium]